MTRARPRLPAVFVLAVGAALAAPGVSAQAPRSGQPATFRTGVTYVEVDAVVTDGSGRFVPGLDARDFVLLEDGQPRTISTFSLVDLPVGADDRRPARGDAGWPDTTTNEDARLGRVYAVVLDDQHTAPFLSQRTRMIMRRFIDAYVGPDDRVAVLSTAPDGRIVTDFTSSRETLLAAVERFTGRKPSWLPPGDSPASRTQVACFT